MLNFAKTRGLSRRERLKLVRVPKSDIILFARQMFALYSAGLALVQCLDTLSEKNENPEFGEIIGEVCRKVGEGFAFSRSLSEYPLVFPKILVVMVRIGEESGHLDVSLQSAAQWLERDWDLERKIRAALSYPLFILSLTGVLTLGLFYGVMPAFLQIFEDMQVELPLMTQFVLGITRAFRSPLFWLAMACLAALAYKATKKIAADPTRHRLAYGLILKIPIWGAILYHGSMSRFCGSVRTLLSAGVNLLTTLDLSGAVCGNPILEHDVRKHMTEAVKRGERISAFMLSRSNIYNPTTTNFIDAGEETSKLPEMFHFASDYNALEAESRIEALKVAIEPLMLSIVAFGVGSIVLSIFLPLYGFLNKL